MLIFKILGESIGIGVIFGIIAAIIAGSMGESSFHMWQAGWGTFAYTAGIIFIIYTAMNFKAIIFDIQDTRDELEVSLDERNSDFFAIAEEEVNNGEINKSLWSQALINAKGDENIRKIEYMKLRAKQLKREE